jgi:hypothetical protein
MGQPIDALIHDMARMAVDLLDHDLMLTSQLMELLDQIQICLGPAATSTSLGAGFQHRDNILAVRDDYDLAAALENFQSGDDGREFHAIVGGMVFATDDLSLMTPYCRMAAYPPGPGFPLQLPSVYR